MDGSIGTSAYIDSAAGTLVWVRRRNGSWWPGRILGPDELPGSHLLSPRSGTPVKLLGREDASVDWYNMEKSRRVKAFRCGEFDDCIERARSLASFLRKKREKYARREDAILHALELERQQTGHRHLSGGSEEPSDFVDDAVLEDDIEGAGYNSGLGRDFLELESPGDVAQSVLSIPNASQGSFGGTAGSQRNNKNIGSEWEDDATEAVPRMRGLQDLGLRIDLCKGRRAHWSNGYESYSKASFTEDESKIASCVTKVVGTYRALNSSKASCSGAAMKRKRCQDGSSADESAYKRRDRRRPLTQVLESSAKLADGVFAYFELGPKKNAPPFVPSSQSDLIIMHPNQDRKTILLEEPFQDSPDLESPSGQKGFEWKETSQMGHQSKQEMLDSLSVVDKACSCLSKSLNTNCCDGMKPLYIGPQREVASLRGSACVDSLHQGGPLSSCSFLSGSAHTGSATSVNDTGFDKSSSISMAENLPQPASSQVWSNIIGKELVAEKLRNDNRLPGQTGNRTWVPECVSNPSEGVIQSNALPIYAPHKKRIEDLKSTLGKKGVDDFESSLLPSRSVVNADPAKASKRLLRQGLSGVSERGTRFMTGEDEAESYQVIPGLARNRNEGLDETVFCKFLNRFNPSDGGMTRVSHQALSKWHAKGRRNARVVGRSHNRQDSILTEVAYNGSVDEFEQGHEAAAVALQDNAKTYKRPIKGRRPPLDIHHNAIGGQLPYDEGAGRASDKDLQHEHLHCVPKGIDCVTGGFDIGSMRSLEEDSRVQRSNSLENLFRGGDVRHCSSVDVPIEVRESFRSAHVPLVSLMSKLNGKAIVGHPVLIERLEKRCEDGWNGAKKQLLRGSKAKKLPCQPVWKTARRTSMQRIPRPCNNGILHDCKVTFNAVLQKPNGQAISRLGYAGPFGHNNRTMRKNNSLIHCASLEKTQLKKFSKKPGLFSQKTRMLSSIAVEDTVRAENTDSETAKSSPVTCIPVHLVFSRIREVLYRQANHVASDSDCFSGRV